MTDPDNVWLLKNLNNMVTKQCKTTRNKLVT